MKRIKKRKAFWLVLISILFISVILFGLPDYIMAQPLPPGLLDTPDQSPIDGGLSILAAVGGAYAVKKLRKKE